MNEQELQAFLSLQPIDDELKQLGQAVDALTVMLAGREGEGSHKTNTEINNRIHSAFEKYHQLKNFADATGNQEAGERALALGARLSSLLINYSGEKGSGQ